MNLIAVRATNNFALVKWHCIHIGSQDACPQQNACPQQVEGVLTANILLYLRNFGIYPISAIIEAKLSMS